MTMTDEPTTDTTGGAAPTADAGSADPKAAKKAKKGRSNLLPALVLAGGIAAAGYFVGGPGASADADPQASEPEVEQHEPGEVIELEPMTVNLDGGRFLRVGVAVLATEEFDGSVDDGGTARFTPEHESRLRDQLIAMFAGRELGSLSGAENLETIKVELLERTDTVLDGHAIEIYLTEFVTQ